MALDEILIVEDSEPMAALIGHRNVLPGLESQMQGKAVGDKFEVT